MEKHGETLCKQHKTVLIVMICEEYRNASLEAQAYRKEDDTMTYIQTLWAKHLEDKRSHQAQEKLTAEANAETQRSHLANEALTDKQLNETIRHQIAQDTETMRHNMVSENEIAQHNRETESIMRMENAIKAQANQLNYAAQHERTITQAETERMKNDTNQLLGMLKNRVDQEQLDIARKNLNATFAKIGQEQERIEQDWQRVDNDTIRARSEQFKNYAQGVNAAVQSVDGIVDIAKEALPTSVLTGESPTMVTNY